jgi:cellulose synthase operon protein C
MSRCKADDIAERAATMVQTVREPLRDALFEGLGRMQSRKAAEALSWWAQRAVSADDRRKIAEAVAGQAELVSLARKLSADPDPSVQANAVWSLAALGDRSDLDLLAKMSSHRDVAVAGNAVAAIGRISARLKLREPASLCAALSEPRTYVRANALAALGVVGARCDGGERERSALLSDPSPVVRASAASLLRRVASSDAAADTRALRRCLFDDRNGRAAAECRQRPLSGEPAADPRAEPVLVFVIPDGQSRPVARAPFALVLADGLMRFGLADRRGAVFEAAAPHGEVSLAVPATLVK